MHLNSINKEILRVMSNILRIKISNVMENIKMMMIYAAVFL